MVRITDVQPDRFTLYVHEAPNKDGPHTTETVSYVVLEAGTWEVADGVHLQVGTRVTTATVGLRISNVWAPVTFSETFSSTPVVLSQVQSNDDPHWVKTRQHNVSAGGFDVALDEEEASATPPEGDLRSHGTETIGWLAMDAGHEDVERPPIRGRPDSRGSDARLVLDRLWPEFRPGAAFCGHPGDLQLGERLRVALPEPGGWRGRSQGRGGHHLGQ